MNKIFGLYSRDERVVILNDEYKNQIGTIVVNSLKDSHYVSIITSDINDNNNSLVRLESDNDNGKVIHIKHKYLISYTQWNRNNKLNQILNDEV